MKRAVRWMTIVILAASLTALTGCWNYEEIENRFVVSGMAVDKGQQGHRYRLTFEVLDIANSAQNGPMKSKLIQSDGNTIADAVDNASKISEKNLYYSNCKIVIFSKQIAQEGLTQVMDWFNRDPKPRFTVQAFVSLEDTAAAILEPGKKKSGSQSGGQSQDQGGEQQEGVISTEIAYAMETVSTGGESKLMHLYDVDNILLGEGKDLTLPCLRKSGQKNPQVLVYGTAIFRGDKYAGYMDDDQTQSYLLMMGIKDSILLVGEKPSKRDISLQIIKNEVSVTPQFSGDKVSMKVKVKMVCAFDEENSQQNTLLNLGVKKIESFAGETLREDIVGEIHQVQQQFGCDIFGFGRRIYQENPNEWKKLKQSWPQKFRTVPVEVDPDVTIVNTEFTKPKGST